MRRKILIVDDDAGILALADKILGSAGHDVLKATDPIEGLKTAKTAMPDLILLDVMMPRMNGYEFFRKLKSKDATKDIPVIVETSLTETRDEFIGLGADSFLEKPLSPEKLLKKVERIFDGSRKLRIPATVLIKQKPSGFLFGRRKLKTTHKKESATTLKWQKKILLCSDNEKLAEFMENELRETECLFHKALNGQDVIDQVIEWEPDLVLLEVQMGTHSSHEIISLLTKVPKIRTNILVYTYARDEEHAKNSIVHRLYQNKDLDFMSKDTGVHVEYYGFFNTQTFKERMKKHIYHLRGYRY